MNVHANELNEDNFVRAAVIWGLVLANLSASPYVAGFFLKGLRFPRLQPERVAKMPCNNSVLPVFEVDVQRLWSLYGSMETSDSISRSDRPKTSDGWRPVDFAVIAALAVAFGAGRLLAEFLPVWTSIVIALPVAVLV